VAILHPSGGVGLLAACERRSYVLLPWPVLKEEMALGVLGRECACTVVGSTNVAWDGASL
jgi:hypothetical protein